MDVSPRRKKLRLTGYDYARAGFYFITICVKNKQNVLWNHEVSYKPGDAETALEDVGAAAHSRPVPNSQLTLTGQMVLRYLQNIGVVYDNVELDCFVIMPNHIHVIIVLRDHLSMQQRGQPRAAVGSRPYEKQTACKPVTLSKIINSFKTLTSKKYGRPLWQRSYYERVIRDEDELRSIRQYILDNPLRWQEDEYFN